jgi:hypothetical protein
MSTNNSPTKTNGMKKVLLATLLMVTVSGIAMSQVEPGKKAHHHAKTEKMQKSDTTQTSSGAHKGWKKKSHTTKPS